MRTRDTDKEQLVKSKAIEQIVKDGFQGFSMNKLAKACNISVATLYIYYKDKDDLIKKLGEEIGYVFYTSSMKDFSPALPFAEGLWKQWQNRAAFAMENPMEVACFEIIKHSPHAEEIFKASAYMQEFRQCMKEFVHNALANKELVHLQMETFWSIAYGPLYILLNFHREGKSMGGKPFTLTNDMLKEAFSAVIKSLTP
ncbi:TetR family transcriptional regulator [Flavobacterium sp. Sd200]|uniref:TetR/AcrR family transcriptional regulator n=1 Tax=Flavobacterium sp. Sd200 TaxID=2692211 RepID=UPI00136E1C51|nr:TetR/AcrR family transcriptional regulator [Flavobacterium sp. Sd200]MXN89939.1 TetR family transcriptional regulator [Flavobacterium sp. Sd200]